MQGTKNKRGALDPITLIIIIVVLVLVLLYLKSKGIIKSDSEFKPSLEEFTAE